MLLARVSVGCIGLMAIGRRVVRSRYRPDPWRIEEWAVSIVGITVAAVIIAVSAADLAALHPSLQPLRWPELPVLPAAAVLLGTLPAWIAPHVRLPVVRRAPVQLPPLEQAA
jgi:energy-coupling factor transport system permease protein